MAGLVSEAPSASGQVAGTRAAHPGHRYSGHHESGHHAGHDDWGHVAAERAVHAIEARAAAARTTPGLIRMGTVGVVVVTAVLAAVIAVAFGGVGGQLNLIAGTDAPEASAATGLYFSLNDMDAQVGNMLLDGASATMPAMAAAKSHDMATFTTDRENAYADLQQSAVTAAGNAKAEREL